MAALTEDRGPRYLADSINETRKPAAASVTIFIGALVSRDATGNLVPAADVGGQLNRAIGVSRERLDNSASGSASTEQVTFVTRGVAVVPAGTLTEADEGLLVHAIDDTTLALTSTNGREFGILDKIEEGFAFVRFG